MLDFKAVLGGLLSNYKLICLLFVPVLGLYIRRRWRIATASREEIRRLVILAAEEAERAEREAEKDYYEAPQNSFGLGLKMKSMCVVCRKPTTTRCSQCKSVNYCSSKCQIVDWRQGHKDACQPQSVNSLSKDKKASSNLGIKKDDSASLSTKSFFKENDRSVHDLNSSDSSSDLRCSNSINISENIPKVESIEVPILTTTSADSSTVSTSSTNSTFTIPSEITDDALFEGSPSRREHIVTTSGAIFSDKSISSEQKLKRSSSYACSDVHYSQEEVLLHKLNDASESRTKKTEHQSNFSKESSSADLDDHKLWPNATRVSAPDDHLSASKDAIKSENCNKEPAIPEHHSRSKAVSSLPPVLKQSPVSTNVQLKGNFLKSRSSSDWDFENWRNSSDLQPRSQEVGSMSFRVSANEYSSGSYGPSVSDTSTLKVTSSPVVHARLSGKTNPISKIWKTPKVLKNENSVNHNSQMNFLYDTFVKLYNGKIKIRPFGLQNRGSNCYANVVLQCLAFTRPLSSYLLQGFHSQSCSKSECFTQFKKEKSECFTCELESLILSGEKGESVLDPKNIMSQVHGIGARLGHGKQEDAHEFLRYAVDTMQSSPCMTRQPDSSIRYVSEPNFMRLIFEGYIRSKIKCMKCQSKSVRNERMMDLTVGIPGDIRTLQEALSRYTATEVLDGEDRYECSRCKSLQKAKKRLKVLEAPNILTIALKRFQSGKFGKLNKPVAFPEMLNMSEYMSSSSKSRDKFPIYQLYAVVVHLDAMNATFAGHYISYVRGAGGKWYMIDDSKVEPVELEKVLLNTAYMLFYARQSPRKIISYDLPEAPAKPVNIKTPTGSESSDVSSWFSSSPSDGSSSTTESSRNSYSTDDWGSDGGATSNLSPSFQDGGSQGIIYEHRNGGPATSTAFLDSDPGRDFRKLTSHCSDDGRSSRYPARPSFW